MKYAPGKAPPPVAERPRCPNCGEPLAPRLQLGAYINDAPGDYSRHPSSWTGSYRGYGAFCTLRCCDQFANAAYRAGYRITQPGAKSGA